MQRVTVTLEAAALRNGTALEPVRNAAGIVSTSTSSRPQVESLVPASVVACHSRPTDGTTVIAATRAATTGDLTAECIRLCQRSPATSSVRRARSCSGRSDRITGSAQTAAGGLAHANVDLPPQPNVDLPPQLRPFLPEERTGKSGPFWRPRSSWRRLPVKSTRTCSKAYSVTEMATVGRERSVGHPWSPPHVFSRSGLLPTALGVSSGSDDQN